MTYSSPNTGVRQSTKSVTVSSKTRHRNKLNPIEREFIPPNLDLSLVFGPTALAGSIARTAALRNAPQTVLISLAENALELCRRLIDDSTRALVTSKIQYLADEERSNFAGSVGAGITDLLMNALGYVWRDNAASHFIGPRPDFIYAGGPAANLGVVIAEAHGSFAKNVQVNTIKTKGEDKYDRQVKPNLMEIINNQKVIHGYSVAFGSNPETHEVFLHVSETDVKKQTGKRITNDQVEIPERLQPVPTSIALPTHRANFFLMKAGDIVSWIDWVLEEDFLGYPVPIPLPGPASQFLEFTHAGRNFLFSPDATPHFLQRYNGSESSVIFAMEIQCAKKFLNGLSKSIIRNILSTTDRVRGVIPDRLELLQMNPQGYGLETDKNITGSEDIINSFAMYRDGLTVFGGRPDMKLIRTWIWHPTRGVV